jgi:hypothetical protein
LTRDDTNVLYDLYHYDQEKLVAAEIDVINKEIERVYVNRWNSVYFILVSSLLILNVPNICAHNYISTFSFHLYDVRSIVNYNVLATAFSPTNAVENHNSGVESFPLIGLFKC